MQKINNLFFLPIFLCIGCLTFSAYGCSKSNGDPYTKLKPGDTYTIRDSKQSNFLSSHAKNASNFYDGNTYTPSNLDSSETIVDSLLRYTFGISDEDSRTPAFDDVVYASTTLYWEIANVFAVNAKEKNISYPFTYSLHTSLENLWTSNFHVSLIDSFVQLTCDWWDNDESQATKNTAIFSYTVTDNKTVMSELVYGTLDLKSNSLYWGNTTIVEEI